MAGEGCSGSSASFELVWGDQVCNPKIFLSASPPLGMSDIPIPRGRLHFLAWSYCFAGLRAGVLLAPPRSSHGVERSQEAPTWSVHPSRPLRSVCLSGAGCSGSCPTDAREVKCLPIALSNKLGTVSSSPGTLPKSSSLPPWPHSLGTAGAAGHSN